MNFDTARTHLRPLREDDLENLVELDSDPQVMRFISNGIATSREEYREVILPRMLSYAHVQEAQGFFAIQARSDGRFLGWVHLRPDRFEPAWLEVGYRLRRSVWGQGMATEVSLQMIAHAFSIDADILSARTLTENLASRRVLEKCGFRYRDAFEYPPRRHADVLLPAMPAVLYLRDRQITIADSPNLEIGSGQT